MLARPTLGDLLLPTFPSARRVGYLKEYVKRLVGWIRWIAVARRARTCEFLRCFLSPDTMFRLDHTTRTITAKVVDDVRSNSWTRLRRFQRPQRLPATDVTRAHGQQRRWLAVGSSRELADVTFPATAAL